MYGRRSRRRSAAGERGADVVVGEHVAGHEGLLRRMLADGDVIGDHSFSHADLANDGVLARSEIDKTKRAIERATGYVPCLFRAPFGDVSPALVQDAAAAGLLTCSGTSIRETGRCPLPTAS